MFGNTSIILFLTKGILHVTWVNNNSVSKTVRREWNTGSLSKTFSEVKSQIGSRPVRILLADEFSYILELTIPQHVLNKRLYIEEQLKTYIPELLHSNEWDYKEIPQKGKEKKVLVFAPVKYIYDALLKASDASGLRIEAIEPVQIAGRRNKNALIGLSQKKDIKGKDEEVLNIIPTHYSEAVIHEKENQGSSHSLIWVIIIVLIILLGCGGVIAYTQFRRSSRTTQPQQIESTPTPIVAEPSPTPEPSPTIETLLDTSSIRVQVLNGTGISGTSGIVQKLLEENGFETITTGNAETYDYEQTIIQKKEEVPAGIIPLLSNILSDYDIEETSPLTTDKPYDVLIIVGKKL